MKFTVCDTCEKRIEEERWGSLRISDSTPQGWLSEKHYCSKECALVGIQSSVADEVRT